MIYNHEHARNTTLSCMIYRARFILTHVESTANEEERITFTLDFNTTSSQCPSIYNSNSIDYYLISYVIVFPIYFVPNIVRREVSHTFGIFSALTQRGCLKKSSKPLLRPEFNLKLTPAWIPLYIGSCRSLKLMWYTYIPNNVARINLLHTTSESA